MKSIVSSMICVLVAANLAAAAVGVDVSTPNVRVQVNSPKPPPPPVTVVERDRVIVKERTIVEEKHDNGKHKGHYKKHKKHKKHDD